MTTAPPEDTRIAGVIRHVQALIRGGSLPVGAALPSEGQLGRDLGVGRSSVREGYRALAAMGVVDLGNGRAPRVGAPSAAPLRVMFDHLLGTQQVTPGHVLQVRRAIEMQAAALAAAHRHLSHAAALDAAVGGMQRAGPGSDAFVEHDLAFHRALATASGNPLLEVMNHALHGVFEASIRSGFHHYADPHHFGALVEAHRRVADAVRAQDAAGAAAAMRDHFAQAELVAALLDLDVPGGGGAGTLAASLEEERGTTA